MRDHDKQKQSVYFLEEMLNEIAAEGTRLDRSMSWIVQHAWKVARKDVMRMPSVSDLPGGDGKLGAGK